MPTSKKRKKKKKVGTGQDMGMIVSADYLSA
jgi:hypothetical protein